MSYVYSRNKKTKKDVKRKKRHPVSLIILIILISLALVIFLIVIFVIFTQPSKTDLGFSSPETFNECVEDGDCIASFCTGVDFNGYTGSVAHGTCNKITRECNYIVTPCPITEGTRDGWGDDSESCGYCSEGRCDSEACVPYPTNGNNGDNPGIIEQIRNILQFTWPNWFPDD
jgi:hypothetical protein